jgi:8-oxo-dGTP pyrophosphatase MutT (NUDIX family)
MVGQIRESLRQHDPRIVQPQADYTEAAVALIVHPVPGGSPELLFIERAVREGDPWSGQMAFPGGRRDRGDPTLQHTASRETHEEVGVRLGDPIGRLDDFEGSRAARPARLVVAPFVYELAERPEILANREVQSTVWVPMTHLVDPSSAVHYRFERPEYSGTFPAVEYQGYTIWGLTYRILEGFFELLGRELARPG